MAGFEPTASWSRTMRATNCATPGNAFVIIAAKKRNVNPCRLRKKSCIVPALDSYTVQDKGWDNMEKATGRRMERRRRGQKAVLGEREKRRLLQLGLCLALFFGVFFAKGLDRLERVRQELTQALNWNVDFEAAFADLGWSVSSGQPVGKSLDRLWRNVFLPQEKQAPVLWREGPLSTAAQEGLTETGGGPEALFTMGRVEKSWADPMAESGSRREAAVPSTPEPEPEPEPIQETAVVDMGYTGPALPDNTTMDRYALGLSETVSPVLAAMTSPFGWREHPISGGAKFHYGVDLAVETGTTVGAFASGTVEYIGESDIYGQYLQLDHGNGVTSFYAHCSKLCVQQGQAVAAGEKVAESGATGEVTGPHLHFEMKKDGVRLNPAYYIHLLT